MGHILPSGGAVGESFATPPLGTPVLRDIDTCSYVPLRGSSARKKKYHEVDDK